MDFLGIDPSTRQGARAALQAHGHLVRDYMRLLDRFRELPACEDLCREELKKMGYDADFLDGLETLTCLPPPGDTLYQGEDSPFELQYNEMLDRIENPENAQEAEQADKEAYDALSPAEQFAADSATHAASLANTFFMLAVDWSQVSSFQNLPFCTPRMQLELLGFIGLACGCCRSAYDRIAMRQFPCALELLERVQKYIDEILARQQSWIREYPAFITALRTRIQLLENMQKNLTGLRSALRHPPEDTPLS